MSGLYRRGAAAIASLAVCLPPAGAARPPVHPARSAATVPVRVFRIGLISYTPAAADMARLKRALQRLGYFEGDTAVYLQRDGTRNGDPNSGAHQVLERDVADMVAWQPDVIVSFITTSSTAILHNPAAAHIPVVMFGAEPVESKLALSRRHPGLQFTGFSSRHVDDLLLIRFLKSTIPNLKTIGLMYNGSYSNAPADIVEMNEAGDLLGVKVTVYPVPRHEDFEPAIVKMKADGMQAFKVAPHELFNVNGLEIGALSLKYRLPAVGGYTVLQGGAIASMGGVRDFTELAPLVDKVLHGANPATTPFQRAGGPQNIVVNAAALHQQGLTVPAALRDEVDTQNPLPAAEPKAANLGPPPATRPAAPEPPPLVITPARGAPLKIYRIAMLAGETDHGMDELRDRLESAGLKEGVNVVYLRRAAITGGAHAPAPGYSAAADVASIVAFRPDLILQMDTPAGFALQANPATAHIPVVGFSAFAVAAGQARSYRHPGLNFTGASISPYTAMFEIRFLKDTIPSLQRIGHLYDAADPTAAEELTALQNAASLAGIAVTPYKLPDHRVGEALFEQLKHDGVQAIDVSLHGGGGSQPAQIGRLALKHAMPAMGDGALVQNGGIAAIGTAVAWKPLMAIVIRVLAGADPGGIAIDRDAWPQITVNLKAAKSLGLTVPAHLVDDADIVIE